MDKKAIKDIMFGGVSELIKNKNFYYFSSIGPQYCRWTEEGKLELQAYMDYMAYKMLEAEEESLNKRAKELVINGLKGENV
jgi:hypothetical protein